MGMSYDALQCPRCGQDRVVFYIKLKGIYAVLKTICPNDKSKKAVRLTLADQDQWIGRVAENVYRCVICGQPIPEPIRITRDGRWIILHLECPTHGLKESRRYILDTIYPLIENLHQNPMSAVASAPSFVANTPTYTPPPPPPANAQYAPPPPPPAAFTPPAGPPSQGTLQFCPDCGAKITPGALFCTNCGAAIEDDYGM
ncbi:MAG: zinc ribbon domain-containing protein [Candidatus Helarchaeota archaeon]